MTRSEKFPSGIRCIRIKTPVTMTEEDAKEILNRWEAVWPEIADFARRKAAEISHRIEVET